MVRQRKKLCAIILVVLIMITSVNIPPETVKKVHAETTYISGEYEYTLNDDDEVTITKYTGSENNIHIPDKLDGYKVIGLGNSLFLNRKTIQSIEIPNTVQNIGSNVFSGTALSKLELPEQLKSIGDTILKGVKGVIEITIPEGVTEAGYYGPFSGSAIKKAILKDGIKAIPNNMFRSCTTLEEVVIPDSVTVVGSRAFDQCTKLGSIDLPDVVTNIGEYAFAGVALSELKLPEQLKNIGDAILKGAKGVMEITIPEGVTEAGYYGPFSGSAIKKAILKDGIKAIPNNMFRSCTTLEEIVIPDSVTNIGNSAFQECVSLTYLDLGVNINSIGSGSFSGCNKLIVFCNYKTMSPVYCINQGTSFGPSESGYFDNENKIIDRKNSMYYANTEGMSTSGALSFTVKYQVKNKWKGELSNQKIVTYIPKFCDLITDSIYVNGSIVKNYNYDENSRKLTISFSGNSCELNYSIKVRSKEKIVSYAYVSANKQGNSVVENIGTINEEFTGISLNLPDTVDTTDITLTGIATADSEVELYVNGSKVTSVTSLKNGAYSGAVTLSEPIDGYPYTIEAKCKDEYDNELSAKRTIIYKKNAVKLNSLTLEYYEHTTKKSIELTDTLQEKASVYFMPNTEYTFKADIKNKSEVEHVYITSTRNNEKKVMEAKYDKASGLYIASGYFDPDNTSYVPGEIGVEYKIKCDDVETSESFDMSKFLDIADITDDSNVEVIKQTDKEIQANIDWSDVFSDVGKGIVNADIKYIDAKAGTSIKDIITDLDKGTDILKYLVPGENGKTYAINIDFSDKDTLAMFLYDTTDAGLTIAGDIISAELNFKDFTIDPKGYAALWDKKEQL